MAGRREPSRQMTQPLGDDRLEVAGELREEQLVLGRGEHGDDALDRLRGAGGVDGGEDLVPGVGGAERDAQRVHVAELADEDDVRVLAQRLAERLLEAGRVGADLELRDERVLGRVQVLDRVFDGDDLARRGSG